MTADTCIEYKMPEHIDYLFPCTRQCSCNNIIRKGWMVRKDGKVFFLEGERKDGKKTSAAYYDPTATK